MDPPSSNPPAPSPTPDITMEPSNPAPSSITLESTPAQESTPAPQEESDALKDIQMKSSTPQVEAEDSPAAAVMQVDWDVSTPLLELAVNEPLGSEKVLEETPVVSNTQEDVVAASEAPETSASVSESVENPTPAVSVEDPTPDASAEDPFTTPAAPTEVSLPAPVPSPVVDPSPIVVPIAVVKESTPTPISTPALVSTPPVPSKLAGPTELAPKAPQLEEPEETNPDALLALISRSTAENDLKNARKWYEVFLKLYPTAAPQYLSYIELELSYDHTPEVEALFSRAFAKSSASGPVFPLAYPPLWTSYLHYIRRRNPLPPVPPNVSTLPSDYLNARVVISKAYEYALSHIGTDPLSTPIWKEYIQFLREGEARSTWEEQAKIGELRRVYTKVLKIPVEDVEGIWRDYDLFEGMVNKVTAKKFLAERSPAYMTARSTLKELRMKLPHSAFLFPAPLPQKPTWTDQDRALVHSWKSYVEWEMANPLELEAVDEVQARVSYAFRKAVGGEGRFYPELWYTASKYQQSIGRLEEGAGYLKLGVQANPTSFLLSFAYAELEEARKNLPAVHSTFTGLITHLQTGLDKLHQAIAEEVSFALSVPDGPANSEELKEMDLADTTRKKEEDRKAKELVVRNRRAKEVEESERGLGLAWVMYMRAARRSEGIKSGRSVFAKARKTPSLSWQVYEASALMEYHCSKDPSVATRIFELGLKAFGDKIDFVDRYLSFLITINDDQNARVLFEKSATKFAPEVVRPLWERWAKYEYLFGDLASAQRLDARFMEMFPKDSVTKQLARRHTYIGIDEIARVDLGFGTRLAPAPAPTQLVAAPSAMVPVSAPAASLPPPLNPSRPLVVPVGVSSPQQMAPIEPAPMPIAQHQPPMAVRPRRESMDRGERMSMRNEPLSKRPRGASPMSAAPSPIHPTSSPAVGSAAVRQIHSADNGWGRKPMAPPPSAIPIKRGRSPDPSGPRATVPHKEVSLHWFLGVLPPSSSFSGPQFRTDDLIGLLSSDAITAIHSTFSAPPPSNGSSGHHRAPPSDQGYRGRRREY